MSKTPTQTQHPSGVSLLKTTLLSAVLASVLLITTVLPAEYGIDPTGIGGALGLTGLNSASPATEILPVPADDISKPTTASPVTKSATELRTDTIKLPLMPGQGAELKTVMNEGETMMFNWSVENGLVSFDMHGERPNSGGAFTSYWLGEAQQSANGLFTAPFDGSHGWYWENKGTEMVTVILKTSGFYTDFYMP